MVGNQKAMLEQALAKVMNLGLNCKQVMGPVCLPSNTATFIFEKEDPEQRVQIALAPRLWPLLAAYVTCC